MNDAVTDAVKKEMNARHLLNHVQKRYCSYCLEATAAGLPNRSPTGGQPLRCLRERAGPDQARS
jgi:hypothetical protein